MDISKVSHLKALFRAGLGWDNVLVEIDAHSIVLYGQNGLIELERSYTLPEKVSGYPETGITLQIDVKNALDCLNKVPPQAKILGFLGHPDGLTVQLKDGQEILLPGYDSPEQPQRATAFLNKEGIISRNDVFSLWSAMQVATIGLSEGIDPFPIVLELENFNGTAYAKIKAVHPLRGFHFQATLSMPESDVCDRESLAFPSEALVALHRVTGKPPASNVEVQWGENHVELSWGTNSILAPRMQPYQLQEWNSLDYGSRNWESSFKELSDALAFSDADQKVLNIDDGDLSIQGLQTSQSGVYTATSVKKVNTDGKAHLYHTRHLARVVGKIAKTLPDVQVSVCIPLQNAPVLIRWQTGVLALASTIVKPYDATDTISRRRLREIAKENEFKSFVRDRDVVGSATEVAYDFEHKYIISVRRRGQLKKLCERAKRVKTLLAEKYAESFQFARVAELCDKIVENIEFYETESETLLDEQIEQSENIQFFALLVNRGTQLLVDYRNPWHFALRVL